MVFTEESFLDRLTVASSRSSVFRTDKMYCHSSVKTQPFVFLALLVLVFFSNLAHAENLHFADKNRITICPANDTQRVPPSFSEPECTNSPSAYIDPQNTHIWVRTYINLPKEQTDFFKPYNLVVMAKSSSIAYINGVKIGENGMPADHAKDEAIGLMDRSFYVRPDILNEGENTITLRMSSHNGHLKLSAPIHMIALTNSTSISQQKIGHYLPSILLFGAFVLAGLYFLVSFTRSDDKVSAGLLVALAWIPAVQLIVEVSRGLWAYPYPFHDTRLIIIMVCATAFGFCLLSLISRLYLAQRLMILAIASVVATLAIMLFLARGMDAKASLGLLLPTLFAAGITGWKFVQGHKIAGLYCISLIMFVMTITLAGGDFLDVYFYYLIAGLLSVLFIREAHRFAEEQMLHSQAKTRADELQAVLDSQEREPTETIIKLSIPGKVLNLSSEQISHISSAGDYIEIYQNATQKTLYKMTLSDIEAQLPSSFLRVHRSHIVNTQFVDALVRENTGTGRLTLKNGTNIPVSRRIMPKVRSALL